MYYFNFLQVIKWQISHAHKALVFSCAIAINKGWHAQERKRKTEESKHTKRASFVWTYFGPLIIPSGSLFWSDAFCFQNYKLEIQKKAFLLWGHIPSILSYVYFLWAAFSQKKDPLCVPLCFGTLWRQSHLEILFKEFATCQHSVSYPANRLVILSIEYKLNFVT